MVRRDPPNLVTLSYFRHSLVWGVLNEILGKITYDFMHLNICHVISFVTVDCVYNKLTSRNNVWN